MSSLDRPNFDAVYRLATATFPLDGEARIQYLLDECGTDQELLDAVLALLDRVDANLHDGAWERLAAIVQLELNHLAEEDPP